MCRECELTRFFTGTQDIFDGLCEFFCDSHACEIAEAKNMIRSWQ